MQIALPQYILTIPVLSREEELEVVSRLPSVEARQTLVKHNLRFVAKVALEYQEADVDLGDLFGWGCEGAMTAVKRFDPSQGVRFISYAVWWIRQSIVKGLEDHAHTVRLPVNQHHAFRRHLNTQEQLSQERLEAVPFSEAQRLNNERDGHTDDTGAEHICFSGDRLGIDADTAEYWDFIGQPAKQDDDLLEREHRDLLEGILDRLKPQHRYVLETYYGLDGKGKRTLSEIGEQMGLTRERVRQLKEAALAKAREPKKVGVA